MGRSGKGMTTYLNLRMRRISNKKHKTRTTNTEVVYQYFMKILDDFEDITSLRYTKRHIKNDRTEAYLFLVK